MAKGEHKGKSMRRRGVYNCLSEKEGQLFFCKERQQKGKGEKVKDDPLPAGGCFIIHNQGKKGKRGRVARFTGADKRKHING